MNTRNMINPTPPQMGKYPNPCATQPGNSVDCSVLLTNEEIILQTHNRQYGMPLESTPTTSETLLATTGQPLMIPRPNAEPIPRIPHMPLRQNVHKPHARDAHNYSLVDDLVQSPAAMSVLEVLQTYPSQRKSLLSALGVVDTVDTQLITFDSDNGEPCLPTQVSFQMLVKIWNTIVYQCIINEGASTCIMFKHVWEKIGSPELVPSTITLRAYDCRPTSSTGICQNFPIELGGKTILIDIEVIDAHLDYNILFGRNYMYSMKAVDSSVFRTMMFPHNGKIDTIDQPTHYEPNHSTNIDNILPLVHVSSNDFPVANIGPRLFQDPSMLCPYQGAPPFLNPSFTTQVCVVSSKGIDIVDNTPITESPPHIKVPPVEEILPQEFPESATAPLITDLPPPL
jgi:hypothetical protein